MLNLIIRFCVKEPWLVVLLTIGLSVAGWISFKSIPIDAIPNIGENQVIVLTPWPGRSPKDIEDQVLEVFDSGKEKTVLGTLTVSVLASKAFKSIVA